jgi:hypothetical protein
MHDDVESGPPDPASVREEARKLLDRAMTTTDPRRKRRLRVRAFELAQVAQLLDAEGWSVPKGPIIGHPRRAVRGSS